MGKTLTARRAPAPPATRVMIDGKPAKPLQIEGLDTPLRHVDSRRMGMSKPVLDDMNVGLLGQVILRWSVIKRRLDEHQQAEVVGELKRYGLRVDMLVRGWANGSVDMSADAE